jgi:hypothetical protein
VRVWLAALGVAAACERGRGVSDQELGGLVVAGSAAAAGIDVARATQEPDELGRALARPFTAELAALGPHGVAIATRTTVTENGAQVSELADTATLEVSGSDGAWHGVYTNDADYGREATWVGGELYLRPRYQRWHDRAAEAPDEPAKLRDGYTEAIAANWELLAPGVELTDAGAVSVGGRTGHKVVVKLAPAPRPAPHEAVAQRAWREHRAVTAVDGEIVLDGDTGVPLSVRLAGSIAFQRDGRTFEMKLDATRTIAMGAATIAAPAAGDVVATPERAREVDDRDFLLQGIAPPLRKADAPTGSAGATVKKP